MEMTGLIDSTELRVQLEQLHQESYGWALNCCARDSSQAEDVLQSVYLKILEGKARFEGKSTLKTWLFAVIRRTAADERRRSRWRRFWLGGNQSDVEPAAEPDDLDETIDRMRLQALFQRALEDLPGRQREVLQLVFYNDLSLADAARVMRVSLGSARTHYERGKKRLRLLLKDFQ